MQYSSASLSLCLAIILRCPTSINHYALAHLASCTFPAFGGAVRRMASFLKWKMVQVDFHICDRKKGQYALLADTAVKIAIWSKHDQPFSAFD